MLSQTFFASLVYSQWSHLYWRNESGAESSETEETDSYSYMEASWAEVVGGEGIPGEVVVTGTEGVTGTVTLALAAWNNNKSQEQWNTILR